MNSEQVKAQNILKERRGTKTIYSKTREIVAPDDFLLHKMLGKGAHGKVILCSKKSEPENFFAMKIIKK